MAGIGGGLAHLPPRPGLFLLNAPGGTVCQAQAEQPVRVFCGSRSKESLI